jgi:hypothetical protein
MGEFENSPKDVTFTDPNGEHVAAVSAGETETISFTDVITGRSCPTMQMRFEALLI